MSRWPRLSSLGLCALAAAAGVLPAARAAPPPPPRTEVPIREVLLSDGTRRYAVDLMIDGAPVTAGLDSGSTGLRVLARAAGPRLAQARGPAARYAFGAGARFDGIVADAAVSIGGAAGTIAIQRVDRVGCTAHVPGCAAGAIDPAHYGVQGDGLPGEGFAAILGTNLASGTVGNPLRALGIVRWIIPLPRPGDTLPGRLVLDPDEAELAAYRRVPFVATFAQATSGIHDAVPGCLIPPAPAGRICGAVLFDTGAPGIRIAAAAPPAPWPNETAATLVVGDGREVALALPFVVGRRAQASALRTERDPALATARLFVGLLPYFGWSVLYDAAAGGIGLAPR